MRAVNARIYPIYKQNIYHVIRFLDLSECLGVSKDAFMATVSFICLRLMRCGEKDDNAGKEGEANIGMIYIQAKSVGKSLTAKMLAYAQGVPKLKHNQILAGGDQVMSGTSV